MAKKIICTKSGKIFDTLTKAGEYIRLSPYTTWKYLNDTRFNRTTLKYYEEEVDMVKIEGFDHYYITNQGEVWSDISNKYLKGYLDMHGYRNFDLYQDSKRFKWKAHRLVAKHFLGDIEGLEVDHINRVRDDNNVLNLQIVTRKENTTKQFKEMKRKGRVDKVGSKFRARIGINYKQIYLGLFETRSEAETAIREYHKGE